MEGQADARHVEAATGLTPQQVKEGERARLDALRHFRRRKVLTMDELARLKNVRPRSEKEYTLVGDKMRCFMFSIDGELDGQHVKGALFAGECIIVRAPNFALALNLAKDGIVHTVELALQLFEEQRNMVVTTASPLETMMVDVGGRRAAASSNPAQALERDPKLKRMIREMIGGQK